MSAKSTTEQSFTKILVEHWEQVSRKFAELAEELPVEKFEWAPLTGTRNFGAVLRHVAFWNQYVAASLRGQEFNDSLNELSPADYSTKEKALAILSTSASDVTAALREHAGDLSPKLISLVVTFLEHTSEHYGQLTVYGRTAGIVPPASRM